MKTVTRQVYGTTRYQTWMNKRKLGGIEIRNVAMCVFAYDGIAKKKLGLSRIMQQTMFKTDLMSII